MFFRFLLAHPQGNIELAPQDLEQPFLTGPGEEHPFLTLKDYFGALQKFVLLEDGKLIHAAVEKQDTLQNFSPSDITGFLVCSEKHGACYHIASVMPFGLEKQVKFCIITAVSEAAGKSLAGESHILRQLAGINPAYLPELYGSKKMAWQTDAGSEEFHMVLVEWLEGYHEWHLSIEPDSGEQKVMLWDYAKGFRFLAETESFEILRQAAHILTCYYDQSTFCQIYPWHHGAGDFVVKAGPVGIAVMLITARQYEPLVEFDGKEEADRFIAAIHFLLNLCLRMRLDRLDGTGEPAWFADFAVAAAVAGFFSGLAEGAEAGRLLIGSAAEFLELMRSFTVEEIYEMYDSLLAIYAEEDADDFDLIRDMLPAHAEELYRALQKLTLA